MHDNALQLLFEKDGETSDYVRYRESVPDNEKPVLGGLAPGVALAKAALSATFGHSAPPILKLTVERA